MAYRKTLYRDGSPRGGIPGASCDTAFGALGNKNRTRKSYRRQELAHWGGDFAFEQATARWRQIVRANQANGRL